MMAHGLLIKIDSLSSETHSVHSRDAEAVGNIHLTLPRCRSACAAVEVMGMQCLRCASWLDRKSLIALLSWLVYYARVIECLRHNAPYLVVGQHVFDRARQLVGAHLEAQQPVLRPQEVLLLAHRRLVGQLGVAQQLAHALGEQEGQWSGPKGWIGWEVW